MTITDETCRDADFNSDDHITAAELESVVNCMGGPEFIMSGCP